MFYYQYDPETGKIMSSTSGWLPEYFEHYIASEIDYTVYGAGNYYVENGEIKVTVAGYAYKKREEYNSFLGNTMYCTAGSEKCFYVYDDYTKYYHLFEKDRDVYKIHCVDSEHYEVAMSFDNKEDAIAMVDNIVEYCHEYLISKNETLYAINHAETAEEIEAITFNLPTFGGE